MSGYAGPDNEAEHAIIMGENGIDACRKLLEGRVLQHCADCGEEIAAARIAALQKLGMKCEYCIECQAGHDAAKLPKMLTRML